MLNDHCHRVSTHLQSINIIIISNVFSYTYSQLTQLTILRQHELRFYTIPSTWTENIQTVRF